MDPFVDDSVTMAKRLKVLGKSVGLDVLAGLPHGFLNLIQVRIYGLSPSFLSFHFLNFKIKNFTVSKKFLEFRFRKMLAEVIAFVSLIWLIYSTQHWIQRNKR